MLTPEQFFYNKIGIRPESDGIKWYSVAFFDAFARLDLYLHHTIYEGDKLPEEGPALFVVNHTSTYDAAKGYQVGKMVGRIIRVYAKASLLDPTIKEPAAVQRRTGHKSDIFNYVPSWLKNYITILPKGVEPIPIPRGGGLPELRDFSKRGREKFDLGLIVGIFINETRIKDGSLGNLKQGAEILAIKNPDVPIYVGRINVGTEKTPHTVRIKRLGTYNGIINDPEYQEVDNNFTVFLADQIANLFSDTVKDVWYQSQKQQTLLEPKLSKKVLLRF